MSRHRVALDIHLPGLSGFEVQAGVRYWADTPDTTGPKGWGLRSQATFLFPK